MTANEMRKLTNKVNADRAIEREALHTKTAKNMVLKYVKRTAEKGGHIVDIKVPKNLTQMALGEAFEKMGYKVKYSTKNGKRFVTVSW
jgi:hypothetical protein